MVYKLEDRFVTAIPMQIDRRLTESVRTIDQSRPLLGELGIGEPKIRAPIGGTLIGSRLARPGRSGRHATAFPSGQSRKKSESS